MVPSLYDVMMVGYKLLKMDNTDNRNDDMVMCEQNPKYGVFPDSNHTDTLIQFSSDLRRSDRSKSIINYNIA